uniref:HMG box domain containing 4a n=1 Tax=Astyanax mexicanus TaxID=7994 RepID=A0A8B9GVZ5_ASTMX
MAFEEIKKKGGEIGLVAGRSQREKRRSYKDLLREEEEIAAQVRKTSKNRPKDSELFSMGGDSHKKKKKHSDDYYHRDRSPSLSSSSSSQPPHSTDTAMGLLQAITSPLATGSDPSPHLSHSSFSHARPPDAEGLKMKLILSPKERNEGGGPNEGFTFPPHSSPGTVGHHLSSSVKKAGIKKEKEKDRTASSKPSKKKQHGREPLPVVGKEVEVEGDSSSSGGELEAGELIIDDSYTHLSKKKKKSKKSKKKKEKEKDRDKDKSSKEKKHSKSGSTGKKGFTGETVSFQLFQPKKKSMTAYQVFCKEYRLNINAEQPGLVFGELSKKLAEIWKQLPEKEKQVRTTKYSFVNCYLNCLFCMTAYKVVDIFSFVFQFIVMSVV